ncbi:hypothetical protein WMY93_003776 [Mugilogobius chulae]|uniref:C2H2-type domain-containing protein n=1 Tax=Mugilogobius chulae TaxID=88201 RepID=A0AAW0PYJ3_9GOBI
MPFGTVGADNLFRFDGVCVQRKSSINLESETVERMMCNSTTRSFRSQLAVIWEKLTKAALMEISNLVDECSAVLHTEISLHKSENEALKKKCYSLEVQLRAAREAHTYPVPPVPPVQANSIAHRLPSDQTQPSPEIEGVFGKDWCMDLWREDKALPREKGTVDAAMTSLQAQTIDLIDRDPDLIFVKEETYDEHPIGHHMPLPEARTGAGIFENNMLQRSYDQQLQSELNNFQLMTESHNTNQQCIQPALTTENLIEEATMNSLVPTANVPTMPAYTHSIDMNIAKDVTFQPKAIKPNKQFECLFCGRIFNYLSSLKVHIRRHSGEKPFNCTVCGKRFAQKTYLKLHQRVHSGERPYSCPDCGKSFSQKSSLNIHLRTHTGERPYSCGDCGKSYAYKYGLNHHQCITDSLNLMVSS